MPGGPGGTRIDPIGANSFCLEWNNQQIATFKEVSGLDSETDVREVYQAGKGGQSVIIKSQGAYNVKAGKLTAKYAAYKGDEIMKWRKLVVDGKMKEARKNVSLIVYTVENEEVMRFNLKEAWPSKCSWSSFSAKSNEPLEVTVVIEHESMELV